MDNRNSSLLGSLMKVGALGVGAAALIGGAAYFANSEKEKQNRADSSRPRTASTFNAMNRETLQCIICDRSLESPIVTMPWCGHTFHRVCLERTHGHADEFLCPKCRPNCYDELYSGSTPSSSSRQPSDLSGQTETTCPANDSTPSPSSTKPSDLSGQTETTPPANDSTASPSSTKPSDLSGQTKTSRPANDSTAFDNDLTTEATTASNRCFECHEISETLLLTLPCQHTFHGVCFMLSEANRDREQQICPECGAAVD